MHLKDVDERLAVRLEQKKGQPLEPKWYIPYLPLASTFGGSSQLVLGFDVKVVEKVWVTAIVISSTLCLNENSERS